MHRKDRALWICRRFFIEPDETLDEVTEHEGTLFVRGHHRWQVSQQERAGYSLYLVRFTITHARVHTIVVLPGGSAFCLDWRDHARDFFPLAEASVPTDDIAALRREHPSDADAPTRSKPAVMPRSLPAEEVTEEIAVDLVREYCIAQEDEITSSTRHADGVIVTTSRAAFVVHSLAVAKHFARSPAYTLYRINEHRKRGLAPRGVAVLPDARRHDLARVDELRAFYREVHGQLGAEELATLLVAFQPSERDAFERLFVRPEDLEAHIDRERIRAAGLSPPQATTQMDGSMSLDFCTFLVAPSDEQAFVVHANRWHVEAGIDRLSWSVEPIARGLPSNLFDWD